MFHKRRYALMDMMIKLNIGVLHIAVVEVILNSLILLRSPL